MAKKTIEKPVQEFKLLSNSALSLVGLYEDEDGRKFNVRASKTTLERAYTKDFGHRLFTYTTEQELNELLEAGKIKRL